MFYVAGTLIAATGVTKGTIIMATFRQAYCPRGMLGRVTATMRFVTMSTNPLGALAGGPWVPGSAPRDALWIYYPPVKATTTTVATKAGVRFMTISPSA